jgi:hypothetical protein
MEGEIKPRADDLRAARKAEPLLPGTDPRMRINQIVCEVMDRGSHLRTKPYLSRPVDENWTMRASIRGDFHWLLLANDDFLVVAANYARQ